ncbi:MAG: hypothetical protein K2K57_13965 [Oscillospiraceae bacterium]|nr:hypothetical protein [Oscillospiraceae bacterium]
MDEIIEDEVRERVCEENWRRMRTVKSNFTVTRIYNIYLGIPMALLSWILLIGWIMQTGTGMRKAINMMAEEPEPVYFPWFAVTAFLVPLIVLLTFLTESKPKWLCNALAFLLHFLILFFAAADFLFRFEPMRYPDMIFLAIYGFLGMWSQDFALRSYKELDYLVTQEGYPDFNFNLEKGRYSRYVKYRNSWLKKQKQMDYFTPSERPAQKPITVRTESETQMEGIAVSESDKSEWFTQKETTAAEVPPVPDVIFDSVPKPEITGGETVGEMGALQTDGEGIIPDELIDDPRRRPL